MNVVKVYIALFINCLQSSTSSSVICCKASQSELCHQSWRQEYVLGIISAHAYGGLHYRVCGLRTLHRAVKMKMHKDFLPVTFPLGWELLVFILRNLAHRKYEGMRAQWLDPLLGITIVKSNNLKI
jgi:hypothetical protein